MTFDLNNFDPNEHKGSGGGGGEQPLPPGNWVFWVKGYKRKQARGKDYIMFICEPVLDFQGNAVDPRQYQPIFEKTFLTAAAAWRLADLLRAVGHNSPININSDRELSQAVQWQPFAAKVKHRTWEGKISPEFDSYMDLPGQLRRQADEIREERATQEATGGGGYGGGDYGGQGGYGAPGGYGGRPSNGGASQNGYGGQGAYHGGGTNAVANADFTDDDIPF